MTAKPIKPPRKLNFETIGSLIAILIGVIALFVAWDQARVMRNQQHASVWPVISSDLTVSGDETTRFVEFEVANAGVGPALIESVSIMIDGEEVARWIEVMNGLFGDSIRGAMNFNGDDIEGSVIAAGETVSVMKGEWESREAVDAAFKQVAQGYFSGDTAEIYLRVCYCSVFDRCWITNASGRPDRIETCPAPTDYFASLFAADDLKSERLKTPEEGPTEVGDAVKD
jgi:hypothetical protein